MRRALPRVLVALLPALLFLLSLGAALPSLAAGRAFQVRTYPSVRSSDSSGDAEAAGGPFWFAQSDYDNATGGQIPKAVRLAADGRTSTWLLDSTPQGYAPIALRRDPASHRIWVLVPLFSTSQSALYALNPDSGAVVRSVLPFVGTALAVDSASGQPWVVGTGKIAKVAGTTATVYATPNVGEFASPIDGTRRIWLETDNGTLASFAIDTGRADTFFTAVPTGMRALDVDADGRVWGISTDQTQVLSFDPSTRALRGYALAATAANWAGIGAGSGPLVSVVSSYGPHLLVQAPGVMTDARTIGILSTGSATITGVPSTVTTTTLTASRTDATAAYADRIAYAEDDLGRSLFTADGTSYSSLLWSNGVELLAGSSPVSWWAPAPSPFKVRAVLPAVVEVRPTDPVNNFLTEVTLTNVDADPDVSLVFRTSSESYGVALSLPAGSSRVFASAVEGLRQLGASGIPAGASGTLTANFANGRGVMAARVYTRFGPGAPYPEGSTTGLGFTSVDPSRELFVSRATLNGLKNSDAFRTNVSVANLCGALGPCPTLSVTATFFDDATGRALGEKTMDVPPGQLGQWNAPLADFPNATGETFSVRIDPTSAGWAGFDAYATVIANAPVQDAAFLRASALAFSSNPTLPVVTDVIGLGGVHFVSEASITSTSPVPATADVTFTSAVSGNTVSEVLALSPGRGVRWPNAVDHFRQLAPAKVEASDYGPVRIAMRDFAGSFASSRTISDNGTGLAFTAVDPFIERTTRKKRIVGLKESDAFRTNLAVVHLGPTTSNPSATISVKVTVADASGRVVGAPLTATLKPGQLTQWAKVLEGLGATGEGYVATIERTDGRDAFDAYITIIDNVTADSTFVRAE